MPSINRYDNRNTPDQQMAANARYRDRQKRTRDWLKSVSGLAAIPEESITTPATAELVAAVIREHYQHPQEQ